MFVSLSESLPLSRQCEEARTEMRATHRHPCPPRYRCPGGSRTQPGGRRGGSGRRRRRGTAGSCHLPTLLSITTGRQKGSVSDPVSYVCIGLFFPESGSETLEDTFLSISFVNLIFLLFFICSFILSSTLFLLQLLSLCVPNIDIQLDPDSEYEYGSRRPRNRDPKGIRIRNTVFHTRRSDLGRQNDSDPLDLDPGSATLPGDEFQHSWAQLT